MESMDVEVRGVDCWLLVFVLLLEIEGWRVSFAREGWWRK